MDGGVMNTSTGPGMSEPSAFLNYLNFIQTSMAEPTLIESFASGYEDVLQAPLQPLMNHLEFSTYATFESDPVKYQKYEEAIFCFLKDFKSKVILSCGALEAESTDALDDSKVQNADQVEELKVIIYVLGAGRGPLVSCALRAAERAGVLGRIRVAAVEKNPNAIVTLRRQQSTDPTWLSFKQLGRGVEIVQADIRVWCPVVKADLIVSELLGSFGDNELSPECLVAATNNCLRGPCMEEGGNGLAGVCIPASYASFVAPVSSEYLYRAVRSRAAETNEDKWLETPYVVKFHRVNDQIIFSPQFVWSFSHTQRLTPSESTPPTPQSFDKFASIHFRQNPEEPRVPVLVHGIAGYFDCVLYRCVGGEEISMSIVPSRHTPDMFSWFPLFFPLARPMMLDAEGGMTFNLWRQMDPVGGRVWYEWQVSTLESSSALYNSNGDAYWIGL